jgi:hypothetical protein
MSLKLDWRCRTKADNARPSICRFLMNDWHFNVACSYRQNALLLALLTAISNATDNFLALAGENYAKLIAKIIFKVNDTGVGIDMFRSFNNIRMSGKL